MEIKDDVGPPISAPQPFVAASPGPLAAELIDEFNSAPETEGLARLVLLRAVLETRSDRGVISWIDGSEMVVAGCHDPFGDLVPVGSRWPLAAENVSALALAAGRAETANLGDISALGVSPALRETYAGLRHLLVVPIRAAGDEIALVCVSRRRAEAFTDHDRAILDVVATAAAQPLRAARLEDQLSAALAELRVLVESAESVELVKTDILRLASHELRTPLTVLHGYLALVGEGFFGDIPEPLNGVLTILERRTNEMNSLVNDMLVAARLDDGPTRSELVATDLRDVVRAAVAAVAPQASAVHRLHAEVPGHAVMASVDSDSVTLAVRNLIDNAVKYSPNGGDVVCRLFVDEGHACIRVSDHGLGIHPNDRGRLFTRFGRVLTSANSHIPGIGLGLYFSREVARRHGGDVDLVDNAGPGSVFELTLPLAA